MDRTGVVPKTLYGVDRCGCRIILQLHVYIISQKRKDNEKIMKYNRMWLLEKDRKNLIDHIWRRTLGTE